MKTKEKQWTSYVFNKLFNRFPIGRGTPEPPLRLGEGLPPLPEPLPVFKGVNISLIGFNVC